MKHLFFADMRELKWAFLWVSVVMVVLTFVGYHHNWGMYHAANTQYMWTALPIIGAYMPLAVLLVSGNEQSRIPRIAMFACLPLSRIEIGLSRYLAPLFILTVASLIAWLSIAAEHFFNAWYYADVSETSWQIYLLTFDSMRQTWVILPVQILLGAGAMALPLMADDIWPQAQTKSYGIIATLAGSFVISELGAFSAQGLWIERLPWILAGAALLIAFETWLFLHRKSLV